MHAILGCYAGPDTGVKVDQKELLAWEKVLEQHHLSMEQGSSPSWLTYGWEYREADTACPYERFDVLYKDQTDLNKSKALALIEKMKAGLSQNAAAKALGITSGNAAITLKRYRNRVESTRSAGSDTLEGEQQ